MHQFHYNELCLYFCARKVPRVWRLFQFMRNLIGQEIKNSALFTSSSCAAVQVCTHHFLTVVL